MMVHLDKSDLLDSDSFYRRNLINCLSGYKSLNLAGTIDAAKQSNVAPFSQVIHIGASPPLVGILFRPHTVARHTLENIIQTHEFTLNHVTPDFFKEAHWAAARWEGSEFAKVGLEEEFRTNFSAPFVKGSPLQVACKYEEAHTLQINGTVLVIGSIEGVFVKQEGLRADGSLDLNILETVTVSGLDEYHIGKRIARLGYPKPDKEVTEM